jgi:hypothetical protein
VSPPSPTRSGRRRRRRPALGRWLSLFGRSCVRRTRSLEISPGCPGPSSTWRNQTHPSAPSRTDPKAPGRGAISGVADPLQGYCGAGNCIDNGVNSPTIKNPTNFGFVVDPGPATGPGLLLDKHSPLGLRYHGNLCGYRDPRW